MDPEEIKSAMQAAIKDGIVPILKNQTQKNQEALEAVKEEIGTQVETQLNKTTDDINTKFENFEFKGDPNSSDDSSDGFKHFGEFLVAVRDAGIPNKGVDKRLTTKEAGSPTQEIASDSAGGYLIPTEHRKQLLQIGLQDHDAFASMCQKIPMQSMSIEYPFLDYSDKSGGTIGGIRWYKSGELGTRTATKVNKFGKLSMKLNKLVGLHYSSDEILEFSPISLEPLVKDAFGQGLKMTLNNLIIRGDGQNEIKGVMNSNCLIPITRSTALSVTYAEVVTMFSRSCSKNTGVWLATPDLLPVLCLMTIPCGANCGAPVFLPSNGASGKSYDTLLGRRIIFSDYCETPGTTSDLMFVDLKYMHLGLKAGKGAGVKTVSSMHVKFLEDQETLKATFWVDGQCYLPQAFSPFKGNTRSPFVVLTTKTS